MTQPKIACPYCGGQESRVKDSRQMPEGFRRRRECDTCRRRFSTIEQVTRQPHTPQKHGHTA